MHVLTLEKLAKDNDIEISNWFIDEGISGTSDKRPAFDKILSGEVTNPPIQYVIVAKADRISRDINLYYAYKNMLSKLNLEIISVSEDWSAQDKLTAMILENFLAMAAAVERESIRIRTSGGRKQKAKRGGYSGGRAPKMCIRDSHLSGIQRDQPGNRETVSDHYPKGYAECSGFPFLRSRRRAPVREIP